MFSFVRTGQSLIQFGLKLGQNQDQKLDFGTWRALYLLVQLVKAEQMQDCSRNMRYADCTASAGLQPPFHGLCLHMGNMESPDLVGCF